MGGEEKAENFSTYACIHFIMKYLYILKSVKLIKRYLAYNSSQQNTKIISPSANIKCKICIIITNLLLSITAIQTYS